MKLGSGLIVTVIRMSQTVTLIQEWASALPSTHNMRSKFALSDIQALTVGRKDSHYKSTTLMDDVNCKNPYLEGGGGEFLKTTQDSCTYRAKFYLVYWSTAVVVFHCIGRQL